MTDILFYHLTETRLEDALPPLIDKSVERGWRVAVQTREPARRDALDAHLWTFREESFLPHGTDQADFAENQPVLLTVTSDNANAATVRFIVDGAEPPPADPLRAHRLHVRRSRSGATGSSARAMEEAERRGA